MPHHEQLDRLKVGRQVDRNSSF